MQNSLTRGNGAEKMKMIVKNAENLFRAGALFVLAAFYSIYFAKMLAQKRRGIRTNQIGSTKDKKTRAVELFMSAATLGIVPAQLISVIFGWNRMPNSARFTGFLIGLTGDMIFLSAVLFMKDSWRAGIPQKDKTELITDGIYAFSRNPAFLGFDFMYIGVFIIYCNPLTAFFTAFAVIMLHMQILQEEKYLAYVFGKPYVDYKKRVFRYLGRIKKIEPKNGDTIEKIA